jgi:hypothetical protein
MDILLIYTIIESGLGGLLTRAVANGLTLTQGSHWKLRGRDYLSGVILVILVPCRPRPAIRPS